MSNGEFGGIETKLNNMSYRLDSMERKINKLEGLLQQILSKIRKCRLYRLSGKDLTLPNSLFLSFRIYTF